MATIEKPTTRYAPGEAVMPAPDTMDLYYEEPAPRGAGWVLFSAIVLGFAGVWAFFEGILAISSSKVYTANATYVFSDLHTWGWIVMGLGILAVLAAFAVVAGSELARWFGIAVAALNAWGQLMFLHANPWWAMAMFTVDILVIYGLAAYGGKRLRTR
jgi:hypothetical protein